MNLTASGVLVRRYAWPLPFVVVELWGLKDDVAKAAVLFSSAAGAEHRRVSLLLPEQSIAKAMWN